MTGVGQTPPDFTAPIGRFRLLAQDTNAVPLAPAEPGLGLYDLFSDAEISGYLAMYEGYSAYRSVGAAYQALAGRAALESKMVKDYDLQVDLTKRAAALQALAEAMFERADKEDLLSGVNSTFGVTSAAGDIRRDLYFEIPFEWGRSPFQWAQEESLLGLGVGRDIAMFGNGENGDGVVVTDGTEVPGVPFDELFDGGELI